MTTIAYDKANELIAVESRRTGNGYIITDKANKVKEKKGVIFIGCGLVSEISDLIEAYFNPKLDIKAYDSIVFIVKNGQVFRMGSDKEVGVWIELSESNEADGSGAKFALAAMDFGHSAEEAVKYAITRDFSSGGGVQVVDVQLGSIIK